MKKFTYGLLSLTLFGTSMLAFFLAHTYIYELILMPTVASILNVTLLLMFPAGIICGIVGIMRKESKKYLSITGLALNIVVLIYIVVTAV